MLDDFRYLTQFVDFHDKEVLGGIALVALCMIITVLFLAAGQ